MRARTPPRPRGLDPASHEYREALEQTDRIARNVLLPTHEQGAPIMEIRDGVPVGGDDITFIPIITE